MDDDKTIPSPDEQEADGTGETIWDSPASQLLEHLDEKLGRRPDLRRALKRRADREAKKIAREDETVEVLLRKYIKPEDLVGHPVEPAVWDSTVNLYLTMFAIDRAKGLGLDKLLMQRQAH